MRITNAEFLKSALKPSDWPDDDKREIAFLGRSNVGKSSLINSLLGVRGLARTSGTPGRTRTLNFFLVNHIFRFVDLPGFGYARAPREIKQTLAEAATEYLAQRKQLVLSIQLVDSRHEPTQQDLQLHDWLKYHHKPHLIVATKSDKLSNNELNKSLNRMAQILKSKPVAYSARTKRGHDEIWSAIEKSLKN
jgi:GTP-binding protein